MFIKCQKSPMLTVSFYTVFNFILTACSLGEYFGWEGGREIYNYKISHRSPEICHNHWMKIIMRIIFIFLEISIFTTIFFFFLGLIFLYRHLFKNNLPLNRQQNYPSFATDKRCRFYYVIIFPNTELWNWHLLCLKKIKKRNENCSLFCLPLTVSKDGYPTEELDLLVIFLKPIKPEIGCAIVKQTSKKNYEGGKTHNPQPTRTGYERWGRMRKRGDHLISGCTMVKSKEEYNQVWDTEREREGRKNQAVK